MADTGSTEMIVACHDVAFLTHTHGTITRTLLQEGPSFDCMERCNFGHVVIFFICLS